MGRRPSGALPVMRRHKPTNTARITVGGKVHSLGRWGSQEAQDRYQTLVAAFLASGCQCLNAGLTVIGRPAAETLAHVQPKPSHDITGGLTVGELARAWLADIEATRPNCRRTSLWHGAIAASRAIRPFATMPAAAFGSKALVEVQRHLVNTKVPARGKAGEDTPAETKRLSRRYIDDIVGRVRQLYHWGVLNELVPDDRVKALEIVPALAKGQTAAKDNPERKPVKPSVVRATLPYMT